MSNYAIARCNSWKEIEANFERYFSCFRSRKVSTIRRAEVQVHFNRLGLERGHATANRALDISLDARVSMPLDASGKPFLCRSDRKFDARLDAGAATMREQWHPKVARRTVVKVERERYSSGRETNYESQALR